MRSGRLYLAAAIVCAGIASLPFLPVFPVGGITLSFTVGVPVLGFFLQDDLKSIKKVQQKALSDIQEFEAASRLSQSRKNRITRTRVFSQNRRAESSRQTRPQTSTPLRMPIKICQMTPNPKNHGPGFEFYHSRSAQKNKI